MRLKIKEEGLATVEVELDSDSFTVGRGAGNDVVLEQAFVSGKHLRVHRGLLVEDLGSKNKTYLDSEVVERPTLIGDRRLTVGGLTLALEIVHDDPLDVTLQKEVAALTRTADESPGASSEGMRQLLEQLVREDHAGDLLADRRSVEEIFLYEAYRFVRRTEKTVTERAGELTKKLSLKTRLPGASENFRSLMAELFVEGGRASSHEPLSMYLAELLDWLPEFVTVYETAATSLVDEICKTLQPESLQKLGEVPSHLRMLGLTNLALWQRAQERLDDITPNYVMDRLDALAREAAEKRLDK